MKRLNVLQRVSQIFFTLLYNAYAYGFAGGTIYQGTLKVIPCPGFNCHSCPAAIFACPIGAIQLFAGYGRYYLSLYVLGVLALIGSIGGRIVCGWACPFGFLQDMLHKIPAPVIPLARILENVKYFILVVVVFGVAWYTKEPWFCKIICPAGTLEAGIPLMALNSDLSQMAGTLFVIKVSALVLLLVWMVFSKRPFCRVLCPLGAIYGLFNRVSLLRMRFVNQECIMDKKCSRACPVTHHIYKDGDNAGSCIRCFRCKTVCPKDALEIGMRK
ncbi:4Fe-4S binding protein [Thermodesulfobacteriota bacterium]